MADPQSASTSADAPLPDTGARRVRGRALGGLLVLAAMVGAVWAFGYWEPRLLPVRTIEVQGELHHHSSEQLHETLLARLDGGFLTADLHALRQAAESLPWVGGAGLRRVWPDRLQVQVQEHRPVARWKDDGLVTGEGVVFYPRGPIPAGLPVLAGDESRSRELVERYLKWRDSLMLAGQLIDTLAVDARGAWSLDLVSGTRVELGTDDIERRLGRFIAAAPQLDAAGRARVVDLRYRNGFAVRWADQRAESGAAADLAGTPVPGSKKVTQTRPKGGATNKVKVKVKRMPPPVRVAAAAPAAKAGAASSTRSGARPGAPAVKNRGQPAPRAAAPADGRAPARALTQAVGAPR